VGYKVGDLETLEGGSGAEALEEVRWIEVQSSPILSSSSANVKDEAKFRGKLSAHMQAVLVGPDGVNRCSPRTSRRWQRGSSYQAEYWPEGHSSGMTSSSHVGIADNSRSWTIGALAEFKQLHQDLNPAHYLLTGGNTFQPSRKRHAGMWSQGFQTPLSPVREGLSIEETSWREQSGKNEASAICDADHVNMDEEICYETVNHTIENHFERHTGFDADLTFPVNETGDLEVECYIRRKNGDPNLERGLHTFVDSIDLEPIPCESPTLLQKRAASIALNSLSTLPASLTLSQDLDKMEIWDSADWDGACQHDKEGSIDMQLIECNLPSFSPKRKSITAACLSVEGKFHSATDSAQFVGRNHMVSVESSTEGSTLNSSSETMDQSWFIDAIEALESMEDIQITKDLCLSSFEENSSTVKQQHQQLDVRALQCHSPDKKVVKRAFSWYGSEVDVQVKNSGYEEEVMRKDGNELHHMGNKTLRSSMDFQPTRSALKSCSNSKRG
jgi:hypothetical protein